MTPRCTRSAVLFAVLLVAMALGAGAGAQEAGPGVSAHRGGAAYGPENTLVAFQNAVRLGADVLEVDVVLSADDELVVIHDGTLDRTTDCTGPVGDKTVDQLRDCDAAYWFTPGLPATVVDEGAEHPLRGTGIGISTLLEFLDWAATLDPRPTLFIESKNIPTDPGFDPSGTAIPSRLVPLIQASGLKDDVAVLAFWPRDLETVKALDPTIRTHFLTNPDFGQTAFQNLAYVQANGHDMSGPRYNSPDFNQAYVEATHAAGTPTFPWTVDQPEAMRSMIALGVDGITTNYPGCLLDELGRARPADVRPPELVAAGYGDLDPCPSAAGSEPDPAPDVPDTGAPTDDAVPDSAADDADGVPTPVTGGGAALAGGAVLGLLTFLGRRRA